MSRLRSARWLRLPSVIDLAAAPAQVPWFKRIAWMLLIWVASVLLLAAVAGLLRLMLAG